MNSTELAELADRLRIATARAKALYEETFEPWAPWFDERGVR